MSIRQTIFLYFFASFACIVAFCFAGHAKAPGGAGEERMQKADSLLAIGAKQEAFEQYQMAADAFRQSEKWQDFIKVKVQAGEDFIQRFNYSAGVAYYNEVLHDLEKLPVSNKDFYKNAIFQKLGALHYYGGSFLLAEDVLESSSVFFESFPKDDELSDWAVEVLWYCYYYLSLVNWEFLDYERSEVFTRKSIDLAKSEERLYGRFASYSYLQLGALYTAFHFYDKGKKYFKTLLDHESMQHLHKYLYQDLGLCYAQLGQPDSALFYHRKGLEIAEREKDSVYISATCEHVGFDYLRMAKFDSSLLYYKRALEIQRKLSGEKAGRTSEAYNLIGRNYFERGNLDSALHYYQKAIISAVEDFDELDVYINPLMKQIRKGTMANVLLFNKGEAFLQKYKASNSVDYLYHSLRMFQMADSVVERFRHDIGRESKLLFADSMNVIYRQALECAYQLYKNGDATLGVENALVFMERNKSRILLENLEYVKTKNRWNDSIRLMNFQIDSLKKILISEERAPVPDSQKIRNINNRLFELTRFMQNQNRSKSSPNIFSFDPLTRVDPKAVQKYCRETDGAVIEYSWMNDDLFILAFNGDGFHFEKLGIDREFRKNLELFITTLSTGESVTSLENYKNFARSAHYLYQKLIPEKIISKAGVREILFIADNVLNRISFEALLQSPATGDYVDYKNLDYLIKSYTVGYSFSMSYHFQNRGSISFSDGKLGAFSFTSGSAPPELNGAPDILGASDEVDAIRSLGIKGDFYKGAEATEENFKRFGAQYNALHLALHASADPHNQYASSLIFRENEGGTDDGRLYAYEIYHLNLSASLVVLSACETGLGKYLSGEGVYSLARGFAYAGAPAVVMSLWEVNDQSTSSIMKLFYRHLKGGKQIDEALRLSKLSFLENADEYTAHPNNWAAYLQMGKVEAVAEGRSIYAWFGGAVVFAMLVVVGVRFKKRWFGTPATFSRY